MITHQPEQYQYSYPQLHHPSSQGMAEVDVMVKDNLDTLLLTLMYWGSLSVLSFPQLDTRIMQQQFNFTPFLFNKV